MLFLGPHGSWFWKGMIDGWSLTAYNLTPDKFTDDVRYEVSVNGRSLQWASMSSKSGIAVFKDGVHFLEKVLISVADYVGCIGFYWASSATQVIASAAHNSRRYLCKYDGQQRI